MSCGGVVVVIPARFESSRFPGKVLADATGRPMLAHVHERALAARGVDDVVIATDDDRIRAAAEAFGANVIMTRRDHPNGTSRIAEAVRELPGASTIVNVQGDEPELDPGLVEIGVAALEAHEDCPIATVATPFAPDEDPDDPNIVKVVRGADGCALYFSRARIPYVRADGRPTAPLKHVGLYVYRAAFLATYVALPPTPLEQAEGLEQLRVLEHGYRMAVAVSETPARPGIDTPEEYAAFVERTRLIRDS